MMEHEQANQPAFVLVRPQMGENIGAAARAMWNFGLARMALVDPRDGWPNPAATAMASGAGRLLDTAQVCASVAEAAGNAQYVYATTARGRDLTKPVMSPQAAMRDARARIASGQKVAVLFGAERAGLDNAEIARANAIVTVPVNPEFPSLNLAQCVLLMGYEWRLGGDAPLPDPGGYGETANALEIEALAAHYEDALDRAGFFFPATKAARMKTNLRNLWSRMDLTRADAQMLHGVMRQMVRWARRGNGPMDGDGSQT